MKDNTMARRKAQRIARRRRQRTRRILLTVCLMALTAAISIGGTVAYLQASDSITNEFTPSNITVDVSETKEDFKMVPGNTIAKDPKVTITNDVDAWLFVKINESTAPDFDAYMTFNVAGGWTKLEPTGETDADEWVYYREVRKDNTLKAFDVLENNQVSVKTTVTENMMSTIADAATKPTLTFTAYAIQKDNFTNVTDAWTEIKTPTDGRSTT